MEVHETRREVGMEPPRRKGLGDGPQKAAALRDAVGIPHIVNGVLHVLHTMFVELRLPVLQQWDVQKNQVVVCCRRAADVDDGRWRVREEQALGSY